MFRAQTYILALLILLAGGVALWFDSQQHVDNLAERFALQLTSARLAAEKNLDDWVNDNVNQAVELASRADVEAQLAAIKDADPKDRRAAFESALNVLSPAVNTWQQQQASTTRPDWIWILDAEGRVVLRSQSPQARGDSVVGIPLVSTLLNGAALDGVWVLGDGTFAVAGAGTQSKGRMLGGVVLGYKLNTQRVVSLTKNFPSFKDGEQAGMALIWASKVLGQSFALEKNVVIPASPDPTPYGEGDLNLGPLPLMAPERGQFIGESFAVEGWPGALRVAVNVEHAKFFQSLIFRQLIHIGATLFLVLIIFFWGESMRRAVMKPLGLIVDHLSEVQRGGGVGVLPETSLKEPYLRLGKLINMIIATGVASRSSSPSIASVQDVLSANPAPSVQGNESQKAAGAEPTEFQFDGIPGLSSNTEQAPVQEVSAAEIGLQALGDDAPPAQPLSPAQSQGIASLFDDVSSPGLGVQPATAAPAQPAQPAAAAPAQPAAAASAPPAPPPPAAPVQPVSEDDAAADFLASFSNSSPADSGAVALPGSGPVAPPPPRPNWNPEPERTVMVQVPEELLEASAANNSVPPPPAPLPYAAPAEAFNPDATVVAAIPEDLLQQVVGGGPQKDPDDEHFREVYQLFIATRKECGEPVADLTYERFLGKLKKNREQLVSKYNCRTVRFQVYVKAGKAALKAVPVRD